MNKRELCNRYIFFVFGLFVMSFGVATMILSHLGNSPISSLPYVFSEVFPPTVGMCTFVMNLMLMVVQLMILGKNFPKAYWLQIPVSVLFGAFVDFCIFLLGAVAPSTYLYRFLWLIGGCLLLSLGVSMQFTANVVLLSGEATVRAIADRWHKDVGNVKVAFDITLVLLAVVSSLVFLGKIIAVREGTAIAAVCCGFIVRWFNGKLHFVNERFLTFHQVSSGINHQKNS